jgi:amidase
VARKKVTGSSPAADRLFEQAIADLRRLGADMVDPADIGSIGEYDDSEFEVLLYEFKADLNKYLATRTGVPIRTLKEAIEFNDSHTRIARCRSSARSCSSWPKPRGR